MTLIIDMANGTEYQGDDLGCHSRQEAPARDAIGFSDGQQAVPGLQLVESITTTNGHDKPEAVIYIDMCALFESGS